MFYEVYIPAPDGEDYDVTITVEADNWMSALKSGLERTGEGAETVRNVMCDIKDDDTIHVTDATTQRVFVLEELGEEAPEGIEESEPQPIDEEEPQVEVGEPSEGDPKKTKPVSAVDTPRPEDAGAADESVEQAPTEQIDEPVEEPVQQQEAVEETERLQEPVEPSGTAEPAAEQQEVGEPADVEVPEGEPSLGEEESFTRDEDELEVGSSTRDQLQEVDEDEPTVVGKEKQQSDKHRAASVGRQDEKVSETLIEDVFLEIQPIHEGDKGMEEVVNFVMDLAMEKIDAESGSILFADTSGTELYFAAARGPKANEVMDFRVPMGKGIVGFCSKEGVSLAIGDAQADPRFYEDISESLGYPTNSLLCAPIQYQGRVYGAVELINKRGGSTFTSDEMNALSYIGRQLAEYVNRVVMERENIEDE